jgi:hypothetical protein
MKLFVKAIPSASTESVVPRDGVNFTVSVKEPPLKGKANKAIIRALAGHFGVSESSVRIVSGWHIRNKVIVIETPENLHEA